MAENILMFFQQKFCRSISNPDMDRLIVDQLGCMAIARTDNEDKVGDLQKLPSKLKMHRWAIQCEKLSQNIDPFENIFFVTNYQHWTGTSALQ